MKSSEYLLTDPGYRAAYLYEDYSAALILQCESTKAAEVGDFKRMEILLRQGMRHMDFYIQKKATIDCYRGDRIGCALMENAERR